MLRLCKSKIYSRVIGRFSTGHAHIRARGKTMLRLVSRSLVNKTSSLHGGSLLLYTVSSLCSAATNDDVTIHDLWSICRPWPKLNRMTKSRACQIFKIKVSILLFHCLICASTRNWMKQS